VPPGDPASLAKAVVQALRDDGWRGEAGAAARARVEREFSLKVWIEKLVSLYREVRAS
jgi:glycosyltransferase involved in cell wall biosynthesis